MTKILRNLNKDHIIAAGFLIAVFIVTFGKDNLKSQESVSLNFSNQWIEQGGIGLAVPACGSALPPVYSCSGGAPLVTFNWTDNTFGNSGSDAPVGIVINPGEVKINTGDYAFGGSTGSYTWNGAANNTSYSYNVGWGDPLDQGIWHNIASGSFTTPNCILPPALTFNASPSAINLGGSSNLSWSVLNNVSSCVASSIPAGWSGSKSWPTGSESVSPISDTTFTLACTGLGGSDQESATVLINHPPIAKATISKDDVSYSDSITVVKGEATPIWLAASSGAGVSDDPDVWSDTMRGVAGLAGKCEWSNLANITKSQPLQATDCNLTNLETDDPDGSGTRVFNDPPGTYSYDVLKVTDNMGLSSTGAVSVTVLPAPIACDTSYSSDKLHVCYFDGKNAQMTADPVLNQLDQIALSSPVGAWGGFDNDWGTNEIDSTGKTDNVSGVWRGKINFKEGKYVFHTISDDGVELSVEGFGTPISNWTDHSAIQNDSAEISLPAGPRNVTLRWYENGADSRIKFWWDYTSLLPPCLNGLVGYYKFDEGGGATASDSSGSGNDGQLVGGSSWVTGANGSAVNFTQSSTDFVKVDPFPAISQFTTTFWFKPSEKIGPSDPNAHEMITKSASDSIGMQNGNPSNMEIRGPSPRVYSSQNTFLKNTWYLFALTFDTTNGYKLYINNSLDTLPPVPFPPDTSHSIFGTAGELKIGKTFPGAIDEVKIYDRVLSAGEISSCNAITPPGPPSPGAGSADIVPGDSSFFCPSNTVRLAWAYSDPDGDPQTTYKIQISTNPGFSSLIADDNIASSVNYYDTNVLSLNETYYWRVMVKDSTGLWSDWSESSFTTPATCTGAGGKGDVRVKRVGDNYTVNTAPLAYIYLQNPPTKTISNPAKFRDSSPGSYFAYAERVAGKAIKARFKVCPSGVGIDDSDFDTKCRITTTYLDSASPLGASDCNASYCKISIDVEADRVTKVVFKYFTPSSSTIRER